MATEPVGPADEPEGDLDLLVESMKAMNSQPAPVDEERKGMLRPYWQDDFLSWNGPAAGSVRVCVLLTPFLLGRKNMQSAHRRYVVSQHRRSSSFPITSTFHRKLPGNSCQRVATFGG